MRKWDGRIVTYIDHYQSFKVLVWLCEQGAVGAVDPGVAVVAVGAFWLLDMGRRVLSDTFDGNSLERREHICTCLDGICWSYDVRICIANVGVWVRIVERGLVWVDGPGGDVDLEVSA